MLNYQRVQTWIFPGPKWETIKVSHKGPFLATLFSHLFVLADLLDFGDQGRSPWMKELRLRLKRALAPALMLDGIIPTRDKGVAYRYDWYDIYIWYQYPYTFHIHIICFIHIHIHIIYISYTYHIPSGTIKHGREITERWKFTLFTHRKIQYIWVSIINM